MMYQTTAPLEDAPHATRVEATIAQYSRAVNTIINEDKSLTTMEAARLLQSIEDVRQMLDTESDPCDYFDYLGYGAFKQCYTLLPGKYIIKFASQYNQTDKEVELCARAAEHEVAAALFVPTMFIPLNGIKLPAYDLCDNCDDDEMYIYDEDKDEYIDNPDYDWPALVTAIIQPVCTPVSALGGGMYIPYAESEYAERPIRLPSDRPVPYCDVRDLGVGDVDWIQALADQGATYFNAVLEFILDNDIRDLHNDNIGWMADPAEPGQLIPVIMDCLSR